MNLLEGKTIHLLCRLALGLLSLVLIIGTAIPLLRSNEWWIRIFDFPRLQIAALIGLTLAGYALLRLFGPFRSWEYALVVDLRRLPNIGSDHFPIIAVLDYDPGASSENEEPQPDAGDQEEANETIAEGKANNGS